MSPAVAGEGSPMTRGRAVRRGMTCASCATRVDRRLYYTGFEPDREATEPADLTFEEGKEQLRHAIRESVRLRLRGDYPLGAFVSGGVDSAIVAAMMRELLQMRTRCCTYALCTGVLFREACRFDGLLRQEGQFFLSSTQLAGQTYLRASIMSPATDEATMQDLLRAIVKVAHEG